MNTSTATAPVRTSSSVARELEPLYRRRAELEQNLAAIESKRSAARAERAHAIAAGGATSAIMGKELRVLDDDANGISDGLAIVTDRIGALEGESEALRILELRAAYRERLDEAEARAHAASAQLEQTVAAFLHEFTAHLSELRVAHQEGRRVAVTLTTLENNAGFPPMEGRSWLLDIFASAAHAQMVITLEQVVRMHEALPPRGIR